jgi:hypothetical protein
MANPAWRAHRRRRIGMGLGFNFAGELSMGSVQTPGSQNDVLTARRVLAVQSAVQVSGDSHGWLALTAQGDAWGWGRNGTGVLGDGMWPGTLIPRSIVPTIGR